MSHTPRIAFALLLCAACGDNLDGSAPPDADFGETRAVLTSGDFDRVGSLSTVGLPSMTVVANAVAGIVGGDPVLRQVGRELFIVNRNAGNNLSILNIDTMQLVGEQLATGPGTNPQDVAVVGRKLYVPLYGDTFSPTGVPGKGVLVLDRDQPTWSKLVDLTSLDPDGAPDCVSAYAVGTEVFVVCGLLGPGQVPVREGRIAVIDTTRDEYVTSYNLGAINPQGQLQRTPADSAFGGDLIMPTVPSFLDYSTGCLARLTVGKELLPNGCAVTNQALAGYVNRAEPSADGKTLWIAAVGYAGPGFMNPFGRLVPVDLNSGALGAAITPASQLITDVTTCEGGWVVVADSAVGNGGIRVYREGTAASDLLVAGRPPNGVANNLACF